MRHVLGFLCVCALVGTLPQSASAQEEVVSSEPASEEPALQLKLDSAGVEAVPSAPRTVDGYTLEEMDLRVRRARIGLLSTMGAVLLGGMFFGIGFVQLDFNTSEGDALMWSGAVFIMGGVLGMITTGGMLAHRKRKRRSLHEAQYERRRRVQWDLARSRAVF